MMQGPDERAVVVRKPDGELDITTWQNKKRKKIWTIPFFRGVMGFCSSMYYGVKALLYSADVSEGIDPEEEKKEKERKKSESGGRQRRKEEKKEQKESDDSNALSGLMIGFAAVLGLALTVVLFILLPSFVTGLIGRAWTTMPVWVRSVIEGVLKVAIFLAYLFACSRMKDIHRVFEYHGAEHKTIFCYENGLELTVDNVRKQSKYHPRCGTSFLFVVIIIAIFLSIVLFVPLNITNTWARVGLHLLLLPIIVAVTYELNRYVGRHDGLLSRILRAPGLWMQRFTVFDPDDSMMEVAIAALKLVIPEEQGKDQW